MEALERITERVCRNGHPDDPETPRPLLSIDEFFEGNDVVGSIGCNLIDIPHPNEFFKVFKFCFIIFIILFHFHIKRAF